MTNKNEIEISMQTYKVSRMNLRKNTQEQIDKENKILNMLKDGEELSYILRLSWV